MLQSYILSLQRLLHKFPLFMPFFQKVKSATSFGQRHRVCNQQDIVGPDTPIPTTRQQRPAVTSVAPKRDIIGPQLPDNWPTIAR